MHHCVESGHGYKDYPTILSNVCTNHNQELSLPSPQSGHDRQPRSSSPVNFASPFQGGGKTIIKAYFGYKY